MFWMLFSLLIFTLFSGFYQINLLLYCLVALLIQFIFFQVNIVSNTVFYILFTPTFIISLILNIKKIRSQFISKKLYGLLKNSNNQWGAFQRIDNGWFASNFERSIFQGKPAFLDFQVAQITDKKINTFEENIHAFLQTNNHINNNSLINKLAKMGCTSLLIKNQHNGQNLTPTNISNFLQSISKTNPMLASILGIINLDSLSSLIYHFASPDQKEKFLPQLASAKMMPFLKPTSLYETLESQKSSIEGRIDREFIKDKQVLGIRLSFQDVILLGISQSNCFYLNVNIKDFNNLLGNKTHLGTSICIINHDIKGLSFRKGLKAYDNYLNYYACTAENIFIPFENILNEKNGMGKGLEYLYRNQYYACSIWPLAVSIPTNNTVTLTAWYFAHLQKQNGRQLLSYKLVLDKLNEQFSQCLKIQLMNAMSLNNNLNPQLLKFTAILNKETYITQTMEQLSLLRGILGSNSHHIKTESRVRSFYKVAHLTTELDGMSHEINQLPLIKKAAIACHPYYYKEINLLNNENNSTLVEFDQIIFQHMGYILHNLFKIWIYTIKSSLLGRLLFPKNKYKTMIKRMSSSFAFLSDITLIIWTFKTKINTSFASHLGLCIQQLTTSIALLDYYESHSHKEYSKKLAKYTVKNSLFSIQQSLKNTINLAFKRWPGIFMKLLLFPLGRPFHQLKVFKPLSNEIENICGDNINSKYNATQFSPFLKKIYDAKQKLKSVEPAEIAVTNATGTSLNTDNYEVLINRCLAAGIVSVEQSEKLREAYKCILDIQISNHFGNTDQNKI